MQHTATHRNTPQHTAIHLQQRNKLQAHFVAFVFSGAIRLILSPPVEGGLRVMFEEIGIMLKGIGVMFKGLRVMFKGIGVMFKGIGVMCKEIGVMFKGI